MASFIKLYNDNTNDKHLEQIVSCLKNGGVIIYPTDTIYAIGCDIYNHKAIEKVAQIKGIKPEKAEFSLIFNDLSQLSNYTLQVDNNIFKVLKRVLPGPFTFILNANNQIPKIFKRNKKTIGIRIPDNNIVRAIVEKLGNPIISTSVHDEDEIIEYTTDPELIYERYNNKVDIVIDGGHGENVPSTIVDCTENTIEIIRQGIGEI